MTSLIKRKPLKSIRTSVYEKRENQNFLKRLSPWFRQKFDLSSTLIVKQHRPEKVSANILDRNQVFLNPL